MRITSLLATATLFLGYALATPVPGDSDSGDSSGGDDSSPPGHEIKIKQFSYGGKGCNQNTIGYTISSDGKMMNLKYDEFAAYAPGKDWRSWCQLNVELDIPHGYQFSIMQTDYRGYCYLEKGLKGSHKSTYYFTGETKQTTRTVSFSGPADGDYLRSDQIGVESVVWSPCGTTAMLNLKQDIQISPPGTSKLGWLDVASTDHKFEQIHYFQWRKCEA